MSHWLLSAAISSSTLNYFVFVKISFMIIINKMIGDISFNFIFHDDEGLSLSVIVQVFTDRFHF